MHAFALMIMAAISSPAAPQSPLKGDVRCEIGGAALTDLHIIFGDDPAPRYYNGKTDVYHDDLLELCPNLIQKLPVGLPLATPDVFKRVQDIYSRSPVTIFEIDTPVVDSDLQHATVIMGYRCKGLCGAQFLITYTLHMGRWERTGEPRLRAIS